MSSILIVPVPPCDNSVADALIPPLQSIFQLPTSRESSAAVDPSSAFDVYRNQYNSTTIISALIDRFAGFNGKVLGVTSVDFFIPVLTFVFGEAQLDGPIAVVSNHRLDDTFYGLPADPQLLNQRLVKEAVHELGHTFGLMHCRDYRCVMHSSTAVEDIDVKTELFCLSCQAVLTEKTSM